MRYGTHEVILGDSHITSSLTLQNGERIIRVEMKVRSDNFIKSIAFTTSTGRKVGSVEGSKVSAAGQELIAISGKKRERFFQLSFHFNNCL